MIAETPSTRTARPAFPRGRAAPGRDPRRPAGPVDRRRDQRPGPRGRDRDERGPAQRRRGRTGARRDDGPRLRDPRLDVLGAVASAADLARPLRAPRDRGGGSGRPSDRRSRSRGSRGSWKRTRTPRVGRPRSRRPPTRRGHRARPPASPRAPPRVCSPAPPSAAGSRPRSPDGTSRTSRSPIAGPLALVVVLGEPRPALLEQRPQVAGLPAADLERLRAARVERAAERRDDRVGNLAARQVARDGAARVGLGDRAQQRLRVGVLGVARRSRRPGPISTIRPRYMIAIRSQKNFAVARSWVM